MNQVSPMPITPRATQRLIAAVTLAILTSSLAACSSTPSHSSGQSAGTPTFGTGTSVAQTPTGATVNVDYRPPAVLNGPDAYIGDNGKIDIVDMATAKTIGTIRSQHPAAPARDAAQSGVAPLLTHDTGSALVLWPTFVTLPDKTIAIELITIHTDTHRADHVTVPLPDAFMATQLTEMSVAALGATGPAVVLQINDLLRHTALAVDVSNGGTTLWKRTDFAATAVADHTVVGTEPDSSGRATTHVAGLDITTGRPLWTQPPGTDRHVISAGPTLVVATGQPSTSPGATTVTQLLNAKSGDIVATLPAALGTTPRCVYDQASVTVCTNPADPRAGGRTTVAFDAHTGHIRWSMPNQNTGSGAVPLVTTAWHGQVYTVETDSPLLPRTITTMTNGRSATAPLANDQPNAVYQSQSGVQAGTVTGAVPVLVNDQGCLAVDPHRGQLLVRPHTPPPGA